MTVESKQEAFDLFERHRRQWLAEARAEAAKIGMSKGTCTADEVRAVCPIPEGVDPRVMGAVFHTEAWEAGEFINSQRRTCHKRPIRVHRWVR